MPMTALRKHGQKQTKEKNISMTKPTGSSPVLDDSDKYRDSDRIQEAQKIPLSESQKSQDELEPIEGGQQNPILAPLFAKVLYFYVLEDLDLTQINKLVKELNFEKAGEKNIKDVSNIADISIDKQVLNSKSFEFLKKIIEKEFNTYKNNVLQYHNNDFKITTSWVTRSEPGQASNYHNHSNCLYSGILYLATPNDCGGISFLNYSDKEIIKLVPTKYTMHNAKEFTLNPKVKMICFFPSDIHHKILLNKSNEVRLSLAFNFFPIGELGHKNSDSFVNLKVV